jgi:serine/threonine-protein kinase
LAWFDRSGSETGRIAQPDGVDYLNPSISPDGRFVAVNRMDPQTANWDVWVIDLARGVPTRVTFDDAVDSDPVWSPDGRELAFVSNRGGRPGLYRTVVGQQQATLIASVDASSVVPSHWTEDGRYIVYTRWPLKWPVNQFGTEIWRVPVEGGKPELLIPLGRAIYGGRVSPDGRWIAYSSLESGSSEVYLRPFGAPGPTRQVSSSGGVHPRWTADGREIVYWTPPRGLSAASIAVDGNSIAAGAPQTILSTPILTLIDARTHWDMTRDGTRLLARVASGTEPPSITVVVNWPARLRQ